MQWQGGTSQVQLIEAGWRWMNALVLISNLDPTWYILSSVSGIVQDNHLGWYAVTGAEFDFLSRVTVTTISPPLYTIGQTGYDDSNFLSGLFVH